MKHKLGYDKELERPKKVLIHSLEYLQANNYIDIRGDNLRVFRDSDEALLNEEGISSINFIPKQYIGKAFDIKFITDDGIKIKTSDYIYIEIKLWGVERVLTYEDDPEYFI